MAIGVSATTYGARTAFPGVPALLPVLGTAAVIAAGTGVDAGGVTRALGLRPLQWLGDASYSVYLWHWPVLLLGAERLHWARWPEAATLVAVTLVLATASYLVVEQPFRTGRVWVSRGRRALVLWPATLAVVAVAGVTASAQADAALRHREAAARAWYAAHQPAPTPTANPTPGHPADPPAPEPVSTLLSRSLADASAGAPVPPDLVNLAGLRRDIWQTRYSCYLDFEAETGRICPVGDPQSPVSVVVFGDSHAGMWLPALDDIGRRGHLRILPLIKLGCGPFDVDQWHQGAPMPSCRLFREWARAQIAELRPAVVLLGYRGLWAVHTEAGQGADDLWAAGALTTLRDLARLAPRRIVLGDIPSTAPASGECLTAPDATLIGCTVGDERVVLDANRLVADAAGRTGTAYVDLTDLVCVRHRCPAVAGDIVIYHDPGHVTMTWARRVAAELGDRLRLDQRPSPSAGRP